MERIESVWGWEGREKFEERERGRKYVHNNNKQAARLGRRTVASSPRANHPPTLSRPTGADASAGASVGADAAAAAAEGLLAADECRSACALFLAAISAVGGDLDVRRLPPLPSGGRCMALSQPTRGREREREREKRDGKGKQR